MSVRLAVVAWLAIQGMAQAAKAPSPPQFGELIEVNVVNIDHVTDRDGRPVTGLRREDFEVLEDGRRMEVTHFRVVAPRPGPPQARPPRPYRPCPRNLLRLPRRRLPQRSGST